MLRQSREESACILSALIQATQHMIGPFALPMIHALLCNTNDSNPSIAAHVTSSLGEVTCAVGESASPLVPELLPVLIAMLSATHSVKRVAALKALGQVCSSTGYTVTPLIDYPRLLILLQKILRSDPVQIVRREVMKVLGILASDPYEWKVSLFITFLLHHPILYHHLGPI